MLLLHLPALRCVCCHSVVGLGWCLCVRVVSLWNGGDGLCWGNGGGVMGMWCLALVRCSLSSPSPLHLVLVFGVVRAQLCEHARYPRTPLCSLFLLLVLSSFSPPFFVPRLSLFGMAVSVRDLPCVGVLGGHDGDG